MDVAELLGCDGPFAQTIPGFAPRPQQQKMAAQVYQALAEGSQLIAEAGTGTGKTFAYLLPAILSGQKVIISTGTRNLQDQLYYKDLPLIRRGLAVPLQTALLKGRANYLCLQRLENAQDNLRDYRQLAQLQRIHDWAGRTRTGDISEITEVPEDARIWYRVTSTTDNCLGQNCPQLNHCFVLKARRQALEADILVINHHILCADMAIKEEGFGEVLPAADAVIIDEAHHLIEVASQFFGSSVSTYQLNGLSKDIHAELQRDAPEIKELADEVDKLLFSTEQFRQTLSQHTQRTAWLTLLEQPQVRTALDDLCTVLDQITLALGEISVRGKGLEQCCKRSQQLLQRLSEFQTVTTEAQENTIFWCENRGRSVVLQQTPLNVSTAFRSQMQQYHSAFVFTSATLAVGEDFDHFSHSLGLDQPATLRLESPFDYSRNALLYHPKNLPAPTEPGYNQALLQAAIPVLEASQGRAFILFTSYQALNQAQHYLADRIDYPLLVQGNLPKTVLLERFRQAGNAVLLGTNSFWEGVDVRGAALSCVIIAKLPFAAPNDPVMQARIDTLRRQGGNPFLELQIPQAVIALKQGVGRLIRDVNDRGVLMLGDPRLLTKSYGRIFLDSLPPMRRTRSLARVREFFQT